MNMRWAIVVLAALLSGSVWAEGNAGAGQKVSEMCEGCHGKAGNSQTPIFPKLAGQHASYLVRQLRDFREKKRVDPAMNVIAEDLSEKDINDVSAFFAAQKVSIESAAATPAGKHLYLSGNSNGAPACSGCHGPSGVGNGPANYPALAGQHAAYVAKTLGDFKTQQRSNDAHSIMRAIAAKLSEDEINAAADYISGLPNSR